MLLRWRSDLSATPAGVLALFKFYSYQYSYRIHTFPISCLQPIKLKPSSFYYQILMARRIPIAECACYGN